MLLQEWPKIRKLVANAHLKIFYRFLPWYSDAKLHWAHPHPHLRELSHRAIYIHEMARKLEGSGVQIVDSVSRKVMAQELSQAEVLAYPCDTIAYTEGFSCTTLEACAARALPVISAADSLGGIYGSCVPMVPAPARDHMDNFRQKVIRALADKEWRQETAEQCAVFAQDFAYPKLAERLESLLLEGKKHK